jgi:cellulose synthase/poly-beta-1,6-N-acetylglucosamine synthase-like glycosyltransferase
MIFCKIVFYLITVYFIFCTLYIFLFAVAGLFYKKREYPQSCNFRKIAVLVPVYKSGTVIEELAENVLLQDYPNYELIIIADSVGDDVLARLKARPVTVMEFADKNRTKALALNTVMNVLPDDYDIALILDADNIIPDRKYLQQINNAFELGIKVLQTHRTAKNTNTPLAVLDALSEEINNHLFRKGHAALGLSSALIGSGMAFDYSLYKNYMSSISSSGEDKELEIKILKEKIFIEYHNDLIVLDEKTQQAESFVNQRARWIANQIMQARNNLIEGLKQLAKGNFDFFNKIMQHCLLPRIFLISSVFLFTLLSIIFLPQPYYIIWIIICSIVYISLLISVPPRMYNRRLFYALLYLPVGALLMFRSLFKTKGATKKFHATEHGMIRE